MSDTKTLLDAILAVQAAATTFAKDRTVTVKTKNGGEYSYGYTPLDTMVEKIGPLLTKNGLVWMTFPGRDSGGVPMLRYRLAHTSGDHLEGEMELVMDPDSRHDIQALGSAITYSRRYALGAVLNLVTEADDDGRGAGGGNSTADAPVCPKCGAAAIIKGKAEYGGGWVCFKKKGGCGAKFAYDPAEGEPPVEHVKRLVRKHGVKAAELRTMLRGLGVDVPDDGNVVTFVEALPVEKARELAVFIEREPIPTGTSDVPGAKAGEFEHGRESANDDTFDSTDPITGERVTVGPGGIE
jgi:hypothetical protein